MKGPTVGDIEESTKRVKERRRLEVFEKVTELLAEVRRFKEAVRVLMRNGVAASAAATEFEKRIERLEWSSCKFARTVGAPCPTLGTRCEICEREAAAEELAESVLGPDGKPVHVFALFSEAPQVVPTGLGVDRGPDETQAKKAEE